MLYNVYTDGACSGNPGPGGYAFVIVIENEVTLKCYGSKEKTTNNCMELTAIARALKHIIHADFIKFDKYQDTNYNMLFPNRSKVINIYSDSAYCVNAMNQGWVKLWKANGWKTKSGTDVKNKELFDQILSYVEKQGIEVIFNKVKGHNGNKYNELADELAKKAIENLNARALPSGG